MNVLDLLSSLRKANIQISLVDDKLKIKAPKGAVTPEIKQQLSEAKQDIIEFLREAATPSAGATVIPTVSRDQALPLSYTQEALWTLDRMNPGSIAYNLPMAFKFFGGLDVPLLERAIGMVLERHEALRLYVEETDEGNPIACFREPTSYGLPVHDLTIEAGADYLACVKAAVDRHAMQPFDLASGPLYRFDLVKVSGAIEPHELLIVCLHHIISDGLSQNLLVREIAMLYASYVQGAPSMLAPLTIQYADFAAWQRNQLVGEKLEQEIRFWKGQLKDVPSLLALPTDRPRPLIQTTRGAKYHFSIPAATAQAVIEYTQANNYTVFMGLMAALQMVLARHAKQTDFCIGMPTAGRHYKEVESLIGFFVNGVLVRASVDEKLTWKSHLDAVKQRLMDVLSHQETPAQLIIDHLDVPRNPSYPPLAQVGFQLQNFSGSVNSAGDEAQMLDVFARMTQLTMEPLKLEEADSKFDMIVSMAQNESDLSGYVEYNTDLFDESTIARLMRHLIAALNSMLAQPQARIANVPLDPLVELAQQLGVLENEQLARLTTTQMAFVQDIELRPDTRQYAVGFNYAIHKWVDHKLLQTSINHVIGSHAALSARFVRCDLPWADAAYQVFRTGYSVELEEIDIGERADAQQFVERHFDKWCYRTHDIFAEELIRFQLLTSGDNSWLLLSCHHIILDGISGMAMLRKIIQCYEALLAATECPDFTDAFPHYIADHHQQVDAPSAVAFWHGKAADVLPLGFSMPPAWPQQSEYQILRHSVGATLLQNIQSYCRKQKTHPSIVYRLIAALMIKSYCRPEGDFVLWDIQSGRSANEEGAIGVFYQQVPYIIPIDLLTGEHCAADFYGQQRRYRREIKDHTYLSLAQLNQLFPAGTLSFQYNYFNFLEPVTIDGSTSLPDTFSSHVDNTVQVFVKDYGTTLDFELWFDGSVFVPLDFLPRMEFIAQQLVTNESLPLCKLRYDLGDERRTLNLWNQNHADLEYHSIVPWLQQSFRDYAANVALIHGTTQFTYAELESISRILANTLLESGVQQGDRVGVYLGRSHWSVISVLSIIQLGAVYIPIEASYPQERVDYILADSGARLLITESCLAQNVHRFPETIIKLDTVTLDSVNEGIDSATKPLPKLELTPQDPIYAIYTSGSTGQPKGALVTHSGEVNLQRWYTQLCEFTDQDRTLIISAFGFDLTQKNLFAPLLCGGAVVVPEMDEFDASLIASEIHTHHVTHINCAPSALYSIVDECDAQRAQQLSTLRWVFLGGEPIRLSALQHWLQHPATGAQVVNSYGPTECTDVVSCYVLTNLAAENKLIPIGKPICNTQLYILNDELAPVPMGAMGEICIAGAGLGLGYIGKDELTAEVFVESSALDTMVYRTGDLGRFCPDGNIEYIGRKDFQVKVRGLRIELGEVESAIKGLAGVSDAVVLVQDDTLVGYGLSTVNDAPSGWQGELRAKLPDYMVPAYLIMLDAWPLTPNGKIDRKALPHPDSGSPVVDYVAPRNEVEAAVASIWEQVLKVERVGVLDSFFDLGGHSLLANQIVSRIRKQFDIELPIRDLILYPSVAELCERVYMAQKSQALGALSSVPRDTRLPLSAAQQRMWLLDQIEPGNAAYHVPSIVTVKGSLSIALVEQAFSAVVNQHEGMRAIFVEDDLGPRQAFLPSGEWHLERIDGTEWDETRLRKRVAGLVVQPFSLDEGPLFRAAVIQRAEQEYLLVVVLHHIITDGWSNGILVRQLAANYVQLMSGQSVPTVPAGLQYADFAAWQHDYLQQTMDVKIQFWREALQDIPALELPLDYPRPASQTFNGGSISFSLSVEATRNLNNLAGRFQATPFMVLMASYAALLQRYSGQDAFAIGSPVAGRDRPELEDIVGFFVNTVAVPVAPEPGQPFTRLLEQIKENSLNCFEHQDVPFEQIVEELNPVRDMSRSPVFQVMLAYQNLPLGDGGVGAQELGDLSLEPYELELESAKFEQTITVWPEGDRLGGALTYNTDLFKRATAQQFVEHFLRFCEQAFAQPEQPLHRIEVLSEEQIQQQLVAWNQTQHDYRPDRIEHLLAAQIEKTPEEIAVTQGPLTLNYRELGKASDAIANALIESGVEHGDFVGIVLDRNLHLMSAILGILKAGAVYVPIDASYPADRIQYICQQSGIRTLITLPHLKQNLPTTAAGDPEATESTPIICLDLSNLPQWMENTSPLNSVSFQQDDLIYVIYTSGSTGKPKGTGAYHRSEANLLAWYTGQFHMAASDRVLLLSAIGFDLTQKNLFAPLATGARLVIPEFQEYDPNRIIDTIESEEVTWLNCAPSAFYPLVENAEDWPRLKSLRYVFLGGEPINMSRLGAWMEQSPCRLVNSYGPTECADIASWHLLDPVVDQHKSAVPIGRPNYNVQLYVLGEHQELLPRGAIGELCIGGDGVGPGYLNQPEMTAAAFLDNPHQPGSLIYRTGDRVRYQEDGTIVYLGRRDHQIKLRGYRVEAGEIQSVINRHPQVKESLVDVIKNPLGLDQLVAWVASGRHSQNDDALLLELKQITQSNLPQFMLPDSWVVIESFQLTANGKIDRKALPLPDWSERKVAYVAPRNALEVSLAEIWAEVLHLDQVGVHDNFFELGGHSLLATQVASRVRKTLGIGLAIRDLMAEPTIAALAPKLLRQNKTDMDAPLEAIARDTRIPLSFAQQRLWLLDKIEPGSLAYSVPSILRIKGKLNHVNLERALIKVFNRHEGLRTVFLQDDEGPYQSILPEQDWSLPLVDVRRSADTSDEKALLAETRRLLAIELMTPFDLAGGPLFRTRLFQLGDDEFVFMVVIHHIVTDGWSMNLLIQDLANAYIQIDLHDDVYFDRLHVQYADFAAWQRKRLDAKRQSELLGYWKQSLAGVEPLNLPTDYQRPAVQTYNGNTIRFSIPLEVREALHQLAIERNTSLFATLLSGFFVLLRQYSGQNDFCIGTPVAGRESAELEKIVGFFVNTLAIRAELTSNEDFISVLEQVKTTLMDGLAHQEMPFEQIVEEVDPARDMSRSPLFQVMLAYQSLPTEQAALGGAENLGEVQLEPFDPGVDSSKYELTLTLWDDASGLGASLQYNTDLFSQQTVERLAGHYVGLLGELVARPAEPIKSLNYLSTVEREQQLVEWNLTDREYDRQLTLDKALTASLAANGERTAVVCGAAALTYAELDQYSNGVAALLQHRGVQCGDRVALCVDRNLHLMSILIGIIKAGACYVPLDASYPKHRIQYILQNSESKLVITQAHLEAVLPDTTETLVLDQVLEHLESSSEVYKPVEVDAEQLLYIIFTSGSTGNPKGTGAFHRSEINLLEWYSNEFNLVASDRLLLLSAIGFDLTQKNLFAPLLIGASLVIPEFNEFDGQKINQLINKEQVTWLNCAPSAFYALQDEPAEWNNLRTLRLLFLGGEPINVPRIAGWLQQSHCQLINSYGPTECADIAAWYAVDVERDYHAPALPIGRPNYNVQLYILGDELELLPTGAVGELCIAGDGVGPGYINDPRQTHSVFVSNPYSNSGNLYRTGDRVRYRTDGNIEYLGRKDHQIKLRGYRIEAGEIQSVINHVTGVKDSLVDVVKDEQGVQRLVAWVVTHDSIDDLEGLLKPECQKKVPAFMVPESWLQLASFPLTPNGKVDRKQLPQPQALAVNDFVAPSTETEVALAKLWSSVLGVDPVGVTDNFFALGGQSLLATQLVSRMSRQLQRTVSVRDLFENPTIRALTKYMDTAAHQVERPAIVKRPVQAQVPLSFGQQRLWFYEQMNPGTRANNMPVAVRIKGDLNTRVLEKAFNELCRRHESLRASFGADADGTPIQRIADSVTFNLHCVDLTAVDAAQQQAELEQLIEHNSTLPISLDVAPLMRASVVKTASQPAQQTLLLCMHHIISDGASQVILFRELMTLYLAFLAEQPSPLPELRIQYPDFAWWQREWLNDQTLASQLRYWQDQFKNVPACLDLPLDKPRPKVQTSNGDTVNTTFPESLVEGLRAVCDRHGVTPFMATLLAWQIFLHRFSGKDDILVGVPTLGRHSPELEPIIGFFIQSLVLRAQFADNPLLADALEDTKQTVLEGFANGDVPVDKIVEHLGIARNPSYSPLAQVAFQLLDNAGFNASQLAEQAAFGDMQVEVLGSQTASAKFDLTLSLTLDGNQLSASLEYNTDLFYEETAANMLVGFERVCRQLVHSLDRPVAAVQVLAEGELVDALGLDTESVDSVQPLSRMQYDMFMDNLVNPSSLQSSHGWNIHIHRALDLGLWQQALREIVQAQPMLRARFVAAQKANLDMGYLVIQSQLEPVVEVIDKSAEPISEQALASLINGLIYKPYAVEHEPLIRYYVIKLAPDHYVVITAVHHAILDGASLNVLWLQWTTAYNQLQRGETPRIATVPFSDYVDDERQKMDTAPVLAFWQNKLAQVEPLDFTVPSPVPGPDHFVTREGYLSDDHWAGVKRFCRQHRITPSLYFKCLFGYLVQQYCRSDSDFSIQETMAGRIKGHQEAMGCYIQEIPFVFSKQVLSAEQRFTDVLEYARQFQKSIKDQRLISIGKQLALAPKGRIGFMYNFYQFLASSEFLGEQLSPEGTPSDPANNVQFVVTEVAGRLKLNLFYHQHLFADFGMLQRIQDLSEQVLRNPDIRLAQFELVSSPAEKVTLLESWNATERHYDLGSCLHQKFEVNAQARPDAMAIIDDQRAYTYGELNRRANQIAHYLIEQGVQSNHLVGLCADRSCDFLVGILGIMKAGGAYVPMDPKYPDDRIEYMISNSEVSVLITQEHLLNKSDAVANGVHRVCLDRDWPVIQGYSAANPNLDISSRNRAYMIYTSGSTGLPKGAIIRHDGALNHIEAECEVLAFAGAFSFLQTAPSSSDISVWQFVGPVTRGGKVVVLDDVTHSEKLFRLVKENKIDVVELVPVALQLLMEFVRQLPPAERALPSLRWMMATGEAVSTELVNDWLALYPHIPVVNAYGPTEAADDVIQCAISAPLPPAQKTVPIGKPLANLKVYIVDELLRLVPAGVAGEICIGGIGVGEGYWRNPEKTAQAFVADPFTTGTGALMYRTGDLGRWLRDGSVEYLDRVDNQVKVRGFRIELGEVEAALSSLPGVRENVVIVRDDMPGGAALAAYVVPGHEPGTDPELDPQRLRGQLRESLPDFMVPAAITVMEALPLTPAGKIDRKSLPRPAVIQSGGGDYVAPRTDTESTLVDIWESLMPVQRVSVTDNFFELGGHSLLGVRIMSKVNQAFGTQLQVAALLSTQTIAKLALLIDASEEQAMGLVVPIAVSEHPPIFMIHPVGGDVLCYADLARALSDQFSVYGIRAKGLDGSCAPAQSMDEIARLYADSILQVQAQGPYQLLGQSLGGILAQAVAAQLERLGHQVENIVMLDTFSPQHLRAGGASTAEILSRALGVNSGALAPQSGASENNGNSEVYIESIYRLGVQAGVLPAEMAMDQFMALYRVAVQNHTIASHYDVEKLNANVHHFTAADNITGIRSGSSWGQQMPQLQSIDVPGGHETMMQGEHAKPLAEQILNRLQNHNNNKV